MSSMLGKTSDYASCEGNMSEKGMMWGNRQPLPVKPSEFLTDVVELSEEAYR